MLSTAALVDTSSRPAAVRAPERPESSMSRRMRVEIGFIVFIGLVLFLLATALPTESWLQWILDHKGYLFDELLFVVIFLCFVLPAFAFRRWQDARRESGARSAAVTQLEFAARTDAQMSQMTNLLHACFAFEEASEVICHYARNLLPGNAGALYVFRSSRNLLEVAAEWGGGEANEAMFGPQHCWALRQGQMYEVGEAGVSVLCRHLKHDNPYICLPMVAHGEVLALLHVRSLTPGAAPVPGQQRALLRVFAERIALALSNLKLRDTLRQQSIRDPLTGLFNRRYLEETLAIEIERARRNNSSFSVIMLDLDHFKRFNDTHGHEAGDGVLQSLGRFLLRHVRGGDIACRYGGEEFTVVLPGATRDTAQQRAEEICEGVRVLPVDFKGLSLGPLTISAGVATFPNQGASAEIVLQSADEALYKAKSEGRDRVVVAG
jgi:diguanylate cyclase (GGDEF)-like protein